MSSPTIPIYISGRDMYKEGSPEWCIYEIERLINAKDQLLQKVGDSNMMDEKVELLYQVVDICEKIYNIKCYGESFAYFNK